MAHRARGLSSGPLPGLVLTFDAFGTLFKPKSPIATQYAEVARDLGLRDIKEEDVKISFKKAFLEASKKYPNYGKTVGMRPDEWWTNIIKSTFTPLTAAPIPPTLPKLLLHRFSSSEGYVLCKDAKPVLSKLRQLQQTNSNNGPFSHTILGVVTNSDHRVSLILESLGIPIRSQASSREGGALPELGQSLDFVTFSYDVGFEKPEKEIFEAARQTALMMVPETERDRKWIFVHVGDDLEKDYHGAKKAGWEGILIDCEVESDLEDTEQKYVVRGLAEVCGLIERWGMLHGRD
ncbi:hypothetical protein RUND412_000362 [Rhizina undulata]